MTQTEKRARMLAATAKQLRAAVYDSHGWISDGSTHETKIVCGRLRDVQPNERGLKLTIETATGKRRSVSWRLPAGASLSSVWDAIGFLARENEHNERLAKLAGCEDTLQDVQSELREQRNRIDAILTK